MGEDAEETLTSTNITEVDGKVYAKVIESLTNILKFERTLSLSVPD